MTPAEILRNVIEAVDLLNQQIGFQRTGGLDGANKVGNLLKEAYDALPQEPCQHTSTVGDIRFPFDATCMDCGAKRYE